MWTQYWRLSHDPFSATGDRPFVATPSHAEAVARLVHVIESGHRIGVLQAAAGFGKSTVLTRALREVRDPSRRIACVSGVADGPALFGELAGRLGRAVPPGAGASLAWRRLVEAARLAHWQGQALVLAVDDCHLLQEADAGRDLDRLANVLPGARVTVLQVGRGTDAGQSESSDWLLPIRLAPLTRGESGPYLTAKLASAGRAEPVFSAGAVTRLHALSGGVPRGLDRLAALVLLAGAARGLDAIEADLVDHCAEDYGAIALAG